MEQPRAERHPEPKGFPILAHRREGNSPAVAGAIRERTGAILKRWRTRSIEVMPHLDRLTLVEFEDSIAEILDAAAGALESDDQASMRRLVEGSPLHAMARFAQQIGPQVLLAEERILRQTIIVELREALDRPLSTDEAASLHELLDLVVEHSLLALMRLRSNARDERILEQVSGLHRLADLGTLVAGLAHDAANLMLPLRTRLDFLASIDLPPEAREDVHSAVLIVGQVQDFITNLRMLSVDPRGGGRDDSPRVGLDLCKWWRNAGAFHQRMVSQRVELVDEVPEDLPRVQISGAVLSQVLFNLIRNAEQAMREQERGRITVRAQRGSNRRAAVDLIVEDDGPGMPREVRERCLEPFFSAGRGGSGLGLAVVNEMLRRAGGEVTVHSPPPDKQRGAMFVLSLPAEGGRETV